MPKKSEKPAAPVYQLLLFTKERCAPCAVAKPQVEKAAAELGLELEQVDALSPRGESLILPFNILAVPTLLVLRDGKKWMEFSGGKDLTHKNLVDRITKQQAKDT